MQIFSGYAAETAAWGNGESFCFTEYNFTAMRVEIQQPVRIKRADLTEWKGVVSRIATRSKTCTIALVGKYVKLHDAYLSVMESLYHAGFENDSQVDIKWVESEDLIDQDACKEVFADVDGIIVPGGFGDRGIEGMIQAAQYARENQIPYFGICLGMQIMVMEFARGVLGYADANSSEFTPDGAHNVIALMADQQGNIPKGGTMRLGTSRRRHQRGGRFQQLEAGQPPDAQGGSGLGLGAVHPRHEGI